jgi:hypothetical protein
MNKPFLLFLAFFFQVLTLHAQLTSDCDGGNGPVYVLDSFYFESPNAAKGVLFFDTSFSNNVWQIGNVQKAGFNGALSGTHALQTDTLNPYPINNESAAVLYLDSNHSWGSNHVSVTFWHFYDTDSLLDSCKLQFTPDSGKTWLEATPGNFGFTVYYSGSLNGYQTWPQTDTLWWSGQSGGWRKESLCFVIHIVKGIQIPRIYGVRFLFQSDSIQTNKPGWMVDNIQIRDPQVIGDLTETANREAALYPNPSRNGIFRVDYPHSFVRGTIALYNSYGQRVRQMPLAETIDISTLSKGMYYYRILFEDTQQSFSGTLIYD